MKALTAVLLLLTTACQAGQLRPTPIDTDDVCARCKMAISQPRYAGQVVDQDGNHLKFDDIACMLRYARDRKLSTPTTAFFVIDYDTGKHWLEAPKAVFVRSDTIDSPMAGGIGAFRDRAAAEAFLKKNKGEVYTFDQLMSGNAVKQHSRSLFEVPGVGARCLRSWTGA